jgi:hypothetical protein
MSVSNVEILGYMLVRFWKNGFLIEEIVQARLACRTDEIEDFARGKNNDFEIAERKFVQIDELKDYINWLNFESGVELMRRFKLYDGNIK